MRRHRRLHCRGHAARRRSTIRNTFPVVLRNSRPRNTREQGCRHRLRVGHEPNLAVVRDRRDFGSLGCAGPAHPGSRLPPAAHKPRAGCWFAATPTSSPQWISAPSRLARALDGRIGFLQPLPDLFGVLITGVTATRLAVKPQQPGRRRRCAPPDRDRIPCGSGRGRHRQVHSGRRECPILRADGCVRVAGGVRPGRRRGRGPKAAGSGQRLWESGHAVAGVGGPPATRRSRGRPAEENQQLHGLSVRPSSHPRKARQPGNQRRHRIIRGHRVTEWP